MPRNRSLPATLAWAVPALVVSVIVFAAYLVTHPYPATGGGLYLAMAEAIRDHGYRFPVRVPGYTNGGLPFAYPPLAFYAVALVRDAFGVDPLALTRYLPGFVTVAYVVPVSLLGRELFADRPEPNRRAGLAALVVAASPAVFKWHLSAGGIVRAPAFLFTVAGLYAGLRLFRDGKAVWVVPGAALFGLTVLTHPSYPVFFGVSYLVFYGYLDRSLAGLRRGALVAVGGLLLASPWWGQVVAVHGFDVFARTAGSRLGIGRGLLWFPSKFLYAHRTRFLAVWHVLALLGIAHLVARKRYLLPLWFAATVLAFPKPRFLVLVGAFVVATAAFDWIPGLVDAGRDADRAEGRTLPLLLIGLLATYGVVTGGLYAANYEPIPERPLHRLQQEPLPSYIDGDDVAAMRWARDRTHPDATFLVAGDAAEWFPVFARRTVVSSPWGAEWLPPDERERQVALYRKSATCASADCIEQVLARNGVSPDYVYLTREGSRSWVAREDWSSAQWRALVEGLDAGDRTEVAFRNEDVAIVRVREVELAEGNRTVQSSALAAVDPSGTVPSSFQPRTS